MRICHTKKTILSVFSTLCVTILLASTGIVICTYGLAQIHTNHVTIKKRTVIVDAGHGEPDGGAVGVDGVIEKDINLAVALKLKTFLLVAGYDVLLTRENDDAIYDEGSDTIRKKKVTDLRNRLAIVNSHPDALFISIHQNIYKSSKNRGSVLFYSPNHAQSQVLAQKIQDTITSMLQPQNNRTVVAAKSNLYILYRAKIPAVMVECGFLSNPDECKLLETEDYQWRMAYAIFCGTIQFEGSKQPAESTAS